MPPDPPPPGAPAESHCSTRSHDEGTEPTGALGNKIFCVGVLDLEKESEEEQFHQLDRRDWRTKQTFGNRADTPESGLNPRTITERGRPGLKIRPWKD